MSIRVSRGRAVLLGVFGVGIGLAYLVAFWIGGNPNTGVTMLVVMLAVTGTFLLLARRSETIAGLVDHRDERIADIDWRAVAISGLVTGVAIIGGAIYEFAQGNLGAPYTWLALVMAVSYVASLIWQRWRR